MKVFLYCIKQGIVLKKTLILLCVRKKKFEKVRTSTDINNYGTSKQLGVFMEKKYNSKIVASGTDLFVMSQIRQNRTFKYSESSGNKIVLPSPLNKRSSFCIYSFMQKIYVISGY